jgi:hypothetical protein
MNEITFDPYVYDKNGAKCYYQREKVWTLEQKIDLIDSIYKELNIGSFLLRSRSYKECQTLIDKGETEVAFKDLVDGKQRFSAIYSFIKGEFADNYGYFWGDFSEKAKRRFLAFDRLSYGEIGENTPDQHVIWAFLNQNHAGTPVDKNHIKKVQQIQF